MLACEHLFGQLATQQFHLQLVAVHFQITDQQPVLI